MPPLAGVFHLAGAVADGVLVQQSWDAFVRVARAKALGAWHLHALTREQPLDWFVMASSIAGVIGSAGQSNYATANAYLDGLARVRESLGLPALSVAWGLWEDAGLSGAPAGSERRRLLDVGLRPQPAALALAQLEQLLARDVSNAVVLPIDRDVFARSPLAQRDLSLLRGVAGRDTRARVSSTRTELDALPDEERRAALADLVRALVRSVLGLGADDRLDDDRGFFDLGMDSLMAVELQQQLQRELRVPLSGTLTFDRPSVRALHTYLAAALWAQDETTAIRGPVDLGVIEAMRDIEHLSERDLDRLLTEHARRDERAAPADRDGGE